MTRRLLPSAAMGVACAALLGCHAGAHLSEPDKDKIRKVVDEAMRLAVKQPPDFDAYVKLYYAENARFLMPNGPTVEGREAIKAVLASFGSMREVKFSIVSMDGMNDLACVHGTYAMSWTPPGATAPQGDKGKYVEIWKRRADGTWKVTHDIFNSDLPPPGLTLPTGPPKADAADGLKRLAFLAGQWTYAGESKQSPLGPAGKISGTIHCDWFAGGLHLVCQGEGKGPTGPVQGFSIYGWDRDAKDYTYYGIESTGFGSSARGSVEGRVWTYLFDMKVGGKPLRMRSTSVEESPTVFTWKDETATGGGPWVMTGEGRAEKVR
jgi:ketosteroid isomerase-like protein